MQVHLSLRVLLSFLLWSGTSSEIFPIQQPVEYTQEASDNRLLSEISNKIDGHSQLLITLLEMQAEMAEIWKGGNLCERRNCAEAGRKTGNIKTPCACLLGYEGDGFDCHDIDECLNGSANCDKDARCINTRGGYTCECNEGYLGNGFNCTEECPLPLPPAKIKGLGIVKLLNFNLDFENAVRACHHIGSRLLEGITSLQQLEELRYHFNGKMLFRSAGIGLRRKLWLSGGKPFTTISSWGGGGCGDLDLSTYPPQIWDIPCNEKRPVLCQKL